jgi:hypothetical protein
MNEENIQSKKPDEIYCPNCAKPISKQAVICPSCGVQIKELNVSPATTILKSFERTNVGANFLFETDVNTLANYINEFFKTEGYELQEGTPLNGGYIKGSLGMRFMFGGFVDRFKFNVNITDRNGMAYLVLSKGMTGASGGIIGYNKMENEIERLRMKIYSEFLKK